MCSCKRVDASDVIIPAEGALNRRSGKPLKSRKETCDSCRMLLSNRQLQMIRDKGYYQSTA